MVDIGMCVYVDIGMCVYFDSDSLLCFCLNYFKIVLMSSIGEKQ